MAIRYFIIYNNQDKERLFQRQKHGDLASGDLFEKS